MEYAIFFALFLCGAETAAWRIYFDPDSDKILELFPSWRIVTQGFSQFLHEYLFKTRMMPNFAPVWNRLEMFPAPWEVTTGDHLTFVHDTFWCIWELILVTTYGTRTGGGNYVTPWGSTDYSVVVNVFKHRRMYYINDPFVEVPSRVMTFFNQLILVPKAVTHALFLSHVELPMMILFELIIFISKVLTPIITLDFFNIWKEWKTLYYWYIAKFLFFYMEHFEIKAVREIKVGMWLPGMGNLRNRIHPYTANRREFTDYTKTSALLEYPELDPEVMYTGMYYLTFMKPRFYTIFRYRGIVEKYLSKYFYYLNDNIYNINPVLSFADGTVEGQISSALRAYQIMDEWDDQPDYVISPVETISQTEIPNTRQTYLMSPSQSFNTNWSFGAFYGFASYRSFNLEHFTQPRVNHLEINSNICFQKNQKLFGLVIYPFLGMPPLLQLYCWYFIGVYIITNIWAVHGDSLAPFYRSHALYGAGFYFWSFIVVPLTWFWVYGAWAMPDTFWDEWRGFLAEHYLNAYYPKWGDSYYEYLDMGFYGEADPTREYDEYIEDLEDHIYYIPNHTDQDFIEVDPLSGPDSRVLTSDNRSATYF